MQLGTLSPTPSRGLSHPVRWFPRQRFQVQPSGEERLCRPAVLFPWFKPRPEHSSAWDAGDHGASEFHAYMAPSLTLLGAVPADG